MQLPYGGVSKALMQSADHGPHPFMSRFMDRPTVAGFEAAGNPTQKSKLLNRLRRKNMQVNEAPTKKNDSFLHLVQ
jgi:hypothetical protein